MANALTKLTLPEIGRRINAHLKRLEAEERERRTADGTARELGATFWMAGAGSAGNRATVTYISYQSHTKLTKAQALHYLAALDAGYEGRHYELFRESPPPRPSDAETRFTALCRGRFGYYLYAVTKRTPTRVYGRCITPGAYAPSFLDRSQVVKLQATEDDLRQVNEAIAKRDAKIGAAKREFSEALARITDGDAAPDD